MYRYLEPLYSDYRKVRRKMADGSFGLARVDEVVDELFTRDCYCDVVLPRIKKRSNLETIGSLEPRKSALEDDFEEEEKEQLNDELENEGYEKDYYRGRSPAKERDRDRRRDSHRHGYEIETAEFLLFAYATAF